MNPKIKEYKTKTGKKRFHIDIYAGKDEFGKKQRERGTFKTYEEAEKAYNSIIESIKNGSYSVDRQKKYKFKDFYKLWLESYKKDVKESTLEKVKGFFRNHILKDMGEVYLRKLTPLMCQDLVNKWFDKFKYDTALVLYSYSAKCLDYACNLCLIEFNPMRRTLKPRKKAVKDKKLQYYTIDELKRYLEVAKNQSFKKFMVFRLLSYTGIRVGEMLALQWSDINFNDKTVSISKTASSGIHNRRIINTPKTPCSYRSIKLDDRTVNYLREWRTRQRKDLVVLNLNPMNDKQLIFSNRDNKLMRINIVDCWNREIAKKAGLRHIKVHGFRHTHASILFASGATMKEVQARLGHSSITVTMDTYTHLYDNQVEETASRFAEKMGM